MSLPSTIFFSDYNVTSIDLDRMTGDLAWFATVGLATAGDLSFANASFDNDTTGFSISFGPGSDYSTFSPNNPDATAGFSFSAVSVPEPSKGMMLAIPMFLLVFRRRSWRRSSSEK